MSTDKKAIAKVSVDDESGVILARAVLPAGLEARRKDLLDPSAIGAARDGLDNFEDRLSHLNSMSTLFDDDEEGDAVISMGGADAGAQPQPQPVLAEVATVVDADISPDADEYFQDDEAVVIGGLSLDDEMMDEDFIQPGVDDGLLSSFDDSDALDFGNDDFGMPDADPLLADIPGAGTVAAADEGAEDVDFFQVDDAEIERNALASQIAIETGDGLNGHAEDLDFDEVDLSEAAENSYPDPVYDDEPELSATDQVRIESPVVGLEVAQSLGSMVDRRRERQELPAEDFALSDDISDLSLADITNESDEDEGDLWGAAGPEDGIVGAWDDADQEYEHPVHFQDDTPAEYANNDFADTEWGANDAGGEDAAGAHDDYVPGSAMSDPTPWADFEDSFSTQGQADTDLRNEPEPEPEPSAAWTEEETVYADADNTGMADRDENYSFADEFRKTADQMHEGAGSVRLTKEQDHFAGTAETADEKDAGGWFEADENDAPAADPHANGSDTDEPDDAGDDQPEEQVRGKKNLAFMVTSAAVAALIAGAGYFGAASMGLIGGGQPGPAAPAPVAQPVAVAPATPDTTPIAPVEQEPVAPAEVAPAVSDDELPAENDPDPEMPDMGDIFDPEAPAEPAPEEMGPEMPAQDGDLADLAMDAIPEPARIDTPVNAVDEAADGLENIARGLSVAAEGDLDSLFLTDNSTPIEAEEKPAFDPAMVTDLLADYAKKEESEELRSAIDLMFEKVTQISEEVTERDERILELEERIVSMSEKANRAETLALAQNEVLVEFVRVKEKVDMAESLIVDLSRRISSMETTDPADRVAVERSLEDLTSRMNSLARDVGLVARVAINGTPEKVRAGSDTEAGSVPGSTSVYQSTKSGVAAPGDLGKVPSDVKVGDFVEGYGYVLQIMPTSDGSRVVVMENKSVLLPN